jgi:hypothetical protein
MPGTDALHSALTGTNIHVPYAWSYADQAAREGASGFAAGDVGKLALQEDDDSLWILTATTPTWVAVAGSGGAGDVTWAIIQASQLVNEFKGYPSLVGIDVDLDAANLWWDKVGTPSTAVTMVDVAGEAGLTETYEYALKTVTDAASEGLSQIWTYADEPRVKSGRKLSAMCAIWSVSALSVTAKLVNSDASETAASAVTAAAWTIVKVENHSLAGTSCTFQVTAAAAGTFYVVPLGACIGEKAVPLGPRGTRYIDKGTDSVVNNADPADTNFADVDVSAATSPLACMVTIFGTNQGSDANVRHVYVRRKGSAVAASNHQHLSSGNGTEIKFGGSRTIALSDGQFYQYAANNASANAVYQHVIGYWEWA